MDTETPNIGRVTADLDSTEAGEALSPFGTGSKGGSYADHTDGAISVPG